MTRGRHPDQGRALAKPVAQRRGIVHMIEPGQSTLIDLVIVGSGIFSAVTLRRAQRLHAPLPDLEAEFGDLINRVRQLPGGERISREIWWYNRDGHLRFFQVGETGLVELSSDGLSLPVGDTPAKKPGAKKAGMAAPAGDVPEGDTGEVPAGSRT
jgi:hypothetical protein